MRIWRSEPSVEFAAGGWQACGDCRRVYRRGEHRAVRLRREDTGEVELVEVCPYADCEASPRYDGVDWVSLAHAYPDSLPHVPERGVRYAW